jgi:RNA recognition motif-containing protein
LNHLQLLFVANLPFSVDDDQLSRIFTELNVSIKSAKVITKPGFQRKGVATAPRSKGFGFVETESQEQQKLALDKLQGYKIDERELVVKVANERQPAPDSPTADGAEI